MFIEPVNAGAEHLDGAAGRWVRSYITKNTDPNGAPVYPGMPISDLSTSGTFAAKL